MSDLTIKELMIPADKSEKILGWSWNFALLMVLRKKAEDANGYSVELEDIDQLLTVLNDAGVLSPLPTTEDK